MIYWIRILAIAAGFATVVSGCVSHPVAETGVLDPRFSWPCERLVVLMDASARRLQQVVGDNIEISQNDGNGRVRFSVWHCQAPDGPTKRNSPLSFAVVSVQVKPDSVPIVITRVQPDQWFSVVQVITDPQSQPLFEALGYDVTVANIVNDVSDMPDVSSFEYELLFARGSLTIDGATNGVGHDYSGMQALIDDGPGYASVFFGPEQAVRYPAAVNSFNNSDETPLSALGADAESVVVSFDRDVKVDRKFWRIPVANGDSAEIE